MYLRILILRCFEILSWHILYGPNYFVCLTTLGKKLRAQEGFFIWATLTEKDLGMVVTVVSQKISLPVVPVKFIYRGTSSP